VAFALEEGQVFIAVRRCLSYYQSMGMAIKCVLEDESIEVPWMEGKSLLMAYLGDINNTGNDGPKDESNIITIDFGDPKKPAPQSAISNQSLFESLTQFISKGPSLSWHDSRQGLAAVKVVLEKLNKGDASVGVPPDYDFPTEDENELHEGVLHDLEQLEKILSIAVENGTKFCLFFDF
jgi:hypothetical protein